ncbi:hypothetical protein BDY24DRAFT_443462 [Mrakia frigida]|uniref:uncharacterized protein n=1 Tax=Mrakia frigida TaxID=29902 RepID=UPI003FCC17B8
MLPTASRSAFQLPAIFRRKSLAIAKSQTGVVHWNPKKRPLTKEDYPLPNATVFQWGVMPDPPPKKKALIRFLFFGTLFIAFTFPAGMIYSRVMGVKNRNYAELYPELFEDFDDDDDVVAAPGSIPSAVGGQMSTGAVAA